MSEDLLFNWDNFVSDLIFHPEHAKEGTDRNRAWAATLSLGILTGGIAHFLIGLYQAGNYFYNRIIQQKQSEQLNIEEQKTKFVFENTPLNNLPVSNLPTDNSQKDVNSKSVIDTIAAKQLIIPPPFQTESAPPESPPPIESHRLKLPLSTPQLKKVADSSPPYAPNPAILQFVLADYVGGGKGNNMDNGIAFYRHYFEEYCKRNPTDRSAANILTNLSCYFSPSLTDPLEKVVKDVIDKLVTDRYVTIPGGYYQEPEGHGILYEFILEKDSSITFKMTNSGEGLEYHPQDLSAAEQTHSIREWRYRTLSFNGASFEDLKKNLFFETLLSFKRPRPPSEELNVTFSTKTNASAEKLYQAIIWAWPGNQTVMASNPGGAQRAQSCAVQSVAKWVKGRYFENQNIRSESNDEDKQQLVLYQEQNFWIKMTALSDYLTNGSEHSSQLIDDAVRKISSHAAKMEKAGLLSNELFAEWNEISQRAHAAAEKARLIEREKEKESGAVNLNLGAVVPVKIGNDSKIKDSGPVPTFYTSTHKFPVTRTYDAASDPVAQEESNSNIDFKTYDALKNAVFYGLSLFSMTPYITTEVETSNAIAETEEIALDKTEDISLHKIDIEVLSDVSVLSKKYQAPLMTEMAYRLNLLRVLPDCTSFDFERDIASLDPTKDRKEFFTQLATLCKHFYYSTAASSTLHLPDAFMGDLINAWMIVYFEAKKDGIIPPKVLLEWMEGMTIMLNHYQQEYVFDSSQSEKRFRNLSELCLKEKQELLKDIKKVEKEYKPIENAWHISANAWRTDSEGCFQAFGGNREKRLEVSYGDPFFYVAVHVNMEGYKHDELKQLPAMAEFAYESSQQYLDTFAVAKDSPDSKDACSKMYKLAARIRNFKDEQTDRNLFAKKLASFGLELPHIPYYDPLREGIMLFYEYADRHLSRSAEEKLAKSDVFLFVPTDADIRSHYKRDVILKDPQCIFSPLYSISTSHPLANVQGKKKYYPETQLPLTQETHRDSKDLNERVKDIFSSEKSELPFLKLHEEREWIAFVQKDPKTYITEMITFFKSKLHRLAQSDYQSTFEHLLFNQKGFEVLRSLFSNHDILQHNTISLLFDFIHNSSRTLLKRSPKLQVGSAFLLNIGFRLLQVAKSHKWSGADAEEKRLLKQWQRLLEKGKENPILGVTLSESVLASLSSIEFNANFQTNPVYLDLIAKTILMGCILPPKLTESKYDPLLLQYGFLTFQTLLNQSNDPKAILKQAAEEIFGKEEASICEWIPNKNQLQLKSLLIDLESRVIEGNDDFNLQPLPRIIQNDLEYQKIFGKRRFFVAVKKQDPNIIYSFAMKGSRYQILFNPNKESQILFNPNKKSLKIFKEIEGVFCSFQSASSALPQLPKTHSFLSDHLFWKNGPTIYGENCHTGKIDMVGDKEGFHIITEGKMSSDILGVFDEEEEISHLFQQIESRDNTVVWKETNSQEISRIQLLGLDLEFTTLEGRLICSNFPGFSVAENQSCAFLGNASNALVLENKKGQKKVIVLTTPISSKKYQPYQKEIVNKSDKALFEFKRPYVVFDLKDSETYPDLSLSPGNVLPLIMLLSTYLVTKQYSQALNLITTTDLLSKKHVDRDSKQLLDSISQELLGQKEKDLHPAAISLRLHLYAWWHKVASVKFDKNEPLLLQKELTLYEDILHSVGPYAVPGPILNKLKKIAQIEAKESLLKSSSSRVGSADIPEEVTFSELHKTKNNNFHSLHPLKNSILKSYEEKRETVLLSVTSPGEEFCLQFLRNYEIALLGKAEEKDKLKRQLALVSFDKEVYNEIPINLLVSALICPEKALSMPQMLALFQKEENEFAEELGNYLKIVTSIFQNEGQHVHLSDWISGKGTDKFSTPSAIEPKLPAITFNTSTNKMVSTDPGRAELKEDFEELPPLTIVPLTSPLDLATFHQDITVPISPEQLQQEIDEEKKALATFNFWVKEEIRRNEGNPVIKVQFERLKAGVKACKKELETKLLSTKVLSQDRLKIESSLKAYQTEIVLREQALEQEEKKILALANDLHGDQKITLEILREQRIPFDIETLLIALGRNDKTSILNNNPTLSENEIVLLMEKVGHYALLKSEYQQLVRCEGKLKDYHSLLEDSEPSLNNQEALYAASNEYFAEAEAKRCFTPGDNSRLLIFEVLGNLLIREEQFNALASLNVSETQRWKLFEARTGFGKSKVLLPLWLLLSAETNGLAIMTVYANLFDQQEAYLQKILKSAYRFFGFRIDFSRESPASKEDIEEIELTLKKAEKLRRPIFMSDQTIHNLLILKIKEIAQYKSTADNYGALEALLSLRRYIKEKGHLFVDEPHKVLNDAEESNYSIGQSKGFGAERLRFSLSLYIQLFKTIEGKYRVDFWQDPNAKTDLPLLTEEEYRERVLPELLENVVQQENIQLDEESKRYLLGSMSFTEQQVYEEKLALQPGEKINETKIRILHDQLYSYLPQTLMRHADEDYAMLSNLTERAAIPMESVRNPKEGNEFVLVDQILNFTIQANLNVPFPPEFILSYIEKLSQEATEEMDKGIEDQKDTLAYKKFSLLFEKEPWCNLLKMRATDYEKLHHEINHNLKIRLQFIGLAVLPTLRRYNEKITSNPHLLTHCFNAVAGAAGTLSMQHLPHQYAVEADEKAMVKTLVALLRKSGQMKETVVEFFANTSQEITKNLLKTISGASVVLEVGASMRNYPSLLDLANDILDKAPEFEGVATFDSKGVPIVLTRGKSQFIDKEQTNISPEKLFWFFGQKDTTGTDQKLPPLAKAVLFINENTTLTEFIQGAGRMRSLLGKQQVVVALDKDSASLIKKALEIPAENELSLLNIFTYCAAKEGEKNGLTNFYSLTKQWNALLENAFWDTSLQIKDVEQVAKDFQLFRNELVDSNFDQPLNNPSLSTKTVKKEEALNVAQVRFEKKRASMQAKANQEAIHAPLATALQASVIAPTAQTILQKMEYPKEIRVSENGEATQQAQATAEQQTQGIEDVLVDVLGKEIAEAESETINEANQLQLWNMWAQKFVGRRALPHKEEIHGVALKRIFSHPELKRFSPLFQEMDLLISENAACTFEGDSIDNSGWVNGYVKPLHYLVQKEGKWILIDQGEAETLLKNKKCETLWLVNHGVLISKEALTTQSFRNSDSFCKRELAAKLLNGDLLFDKDQWDLFSSWVGGMDEEKKNLLKGFFEKILFNLHPHLETSAEYHRVHSLLHP